MILFVTALFDDAGNFLESGAAEVPIWPEGASLFDKPHSSCGVIRLKEGINIREVHRYVEPDGKGGARFKDNIMEIATMCSRRTPATRELLAEKLASEGDAAMHVLARTWLAEKLPEEKALYFGAPINADERALPVVTAMMEKKLQKDHDLPPVGFQQFERQQVAEVHQRIAADSAFAEMTEAINKGAST